MYGVLWCVVDRKGVPVPWRPLAVSWRCQGGSVSLPCRYGGVTVAVPWRYRGGTVALPWRYCGVTVAVLWRYRGGTGRAHFPLRGGCGGCVALLMVHAPPSPRSTILTHVEPFSCYGAVVLSVCRRNRGLWHVRGATPLALCRAAPALLGTVALLWRQRGATVALPWRYRGATVALPWRYRGATVALPWHSRGAPVAFTVHRCPPESTLARPRQQQQDEP